MKTFLLTTLFCSAALLAGCTSNSTSSEQASAETDSVPAPPQDERLTYTEAINQQDEVGTAETPTFEQPNDRLQEQADAILTQYLKIKDALVSGQADGAKAAAQNLVSTLSQFDLANTTAEQRDYYTAVATKVREEAEGIEKAGGLAKQRNRLATLSPTVYQLVKAFHANEQTVYYQFCPMAENEKGAYWISQTEKIQNPYFGDEMLTCGETRESLVSN
ncbi:Protein of unknown function [Catalinimonas alkaloidigena]|uniref:DUF3347 domain-containing protein n=1 Tax=Catalinimonas alkaloidigena TaxID=1075417 RepID=A0A1G9A2N7_9BACT|nr:DUF3347 domain-containing protein [Catalinimonas alkaloidigena]SDK21521.1 Protein of unknown function [Catalinimonas alkaloidigena]